MSGEHIRGIPRTYEKEITLADTPYTLSVGFNCVKVDTTGGNVRVNLPNVNYPIDVIKTSSDSYIVTVWVAGVQKATVSGELSKITIENAEVTQDEPWYPYDAIVGIAGVSGDGGDVLAKDRYGRVIAGGRGVAGTDDLNVFQAALSYDSICLMSDLHFSYPAVIDSNRRLFSPNLSTIYANSDFSRPAGAWHTPSLLINEHDYYNETPDTNIVIDGVVFDGTDAKALSVACNGVVFRNVQNCSIRNCITNHMTQFGFFISIGNGGTIHQGRPLFNNIVGCVVNDVDMDGIVCTGSRISLLNNLVYDAGASGVGLEEADDSIISNNIIYSSVTGVRCTNASNGYSNRNTISSNVVHECTSNGIHIAGYENRVGSNDVYASLVKVTDVCGIKLDASRSLIIGNNIYGPLYDYGIRDNATGNRISNNRIREVNRGFSPIGSTNGSFSGNHIYSTASYGIAAYSTPSPYWIEDNTIENTAAGVGAVYCSNQSPIIYFRRNRIIGGTYTNCLHLNTVQNWVVEDNYFVVGTSGYIYQISCANNSFAKNRNYIGPGESRSASGLLTAGNANAIAFAWHNPELQDILIKKVTIRITTPGGTAGSLLDVGIADDAAGTNRGTEFFDDVDLNTAAIVKSTIATPGTQTVEVFCQDSVSATDGWIVGQILVENAASLVGSYYIEYEGA